MTICGRIMISTNQIKSSDSCVIFFVAACGVETEGAVIFLCVFTVLLGIAVFVSVVGGVAGCVTVAPPSGWTMLSVISCTLLRVVTHCLYSSRVGVW